MFAKPNESYYLTTPIYYVNGVPHLGTAYTTIAADALARFERMNGKDTWFLTGLDEHGQKVAQAAESGGLSPQEWVDGIAPKFLEAWKSLHITNNDFIRTTEPRHIKGVQRFFEILYERGYIYEDMYKGLYCVPDETFFTDEQLADFAEEALSSGAPTTDDQGQKLCPDCGRPLIYLEEKNLFFKLSAFEDKLLKLYEDNPGFVSPQIRMNEVSSFVKSGLKDLSISRTTFDWGVPLTFAPGHVSYVWFDALLNYITAIGYGSDDEADVANFKRRWPAQVHFVGKDIIRFHCVIWPAMLMAANIEPPKKVFAHGFLLTKGDKFKISKSRGNAISPEELCKVFSVDGYRYYFLSDVAFGADGTISMERIVQVYNADLANSWGNLCSRAFNMTKKYFEGQVPTLSAEVASSLTQRLGNPLADILDGLYERYVAAFDALDYTAAMAEAMALCKRANLYIEEMAPWNLAKAAAVATAAAAATVDAIATTDATAAIDATATTDATAATAVMSDEALAGTDAQQQLAFVIYNVLESIRIIAMLFAPVMPTSSDQVWQRLGLGSVEQVSDLRAQVVWGKLPAAGLVEVGKPLFMRLKEEEV